MSMDNGRPLPKFGEWDVNDPASADGFTVIFNKARDEKKNESNGGGNGVLPSQQRRYEKTSKQNDDVKYRSKRKWFCCG